MTEITPEPIYSVWDTAAQSLGDWLEGEQVTFLRHWYDTLNPDLLNPNIHWTNADRSPYGGTFIGSKAVKDGYFTPLRHDFENWRVTVEEINGFGSEGNIIVRGHFQGRARATGIEVMVPFANFWKVHGSKIVSVQQYTDTRILADALIPRGLLKTRPYKTRA